METNTQEPTPGQATPEVPIKYQKIGEIRHLIPQFKIFYYEQKNANLEITPMAIVHEFNKVIAPERFYPNYGQYATWRKRWDRDIIEQAQLANPNAIIPRHMIQDIVTTDPEGNAIVPKFEDLEGGASTLAGELLNDANRMLKEDQENDEVFTPDELIKRRNYALNVMTHIAKIIQGGKIIAIKANAEKRETANFLMDLMKRSTAGKITPEEVDELQRTVEVELQAQQNG